MNTINLLDEECMKRKVQCLELARKASQMFYQGDLPTASFFFTVLKEVWGELKELEREADGHAVSEVIARHPSAEPRKAWWERV